MAPPRAASRLASRKSIVPDPTLYNPIDSDEEDSDNNNNRRIAAPPPKAKPVPRAAAKGRAAVASTTTTNDVEPTTTTTTTTGRRRSTRLSTDSTAPTKAIASTSSTSHDTTNNNKTVDKQTTSRGVGGRKSEVAVAVGGVGGEAVGKGKKSRTRTMREEEEADDEGGMTTGGDEEVEETRGKGRGGKRAKVEKEVGGKSGVATAVPTTTTSKPSTTRAAFIPRAATSQTRINKPPPQYANTLNDTAEDGEEEDSEPFAFTTNPPTPHVAGQAKRNLNATSGRNRNPRAMKTARHASPTSSSPERVPSTSRQPFLSPPGRGRSASAPIHPAETPVQVRNIAFRQGEVGTPGTVGRSVKRSSVKGSGRRGSSIGGGFEAVPHPQIPDDKLYRSTDSNEPVARRLRSLISWAAQRQRDKLFPSSSPPTDTNSIIAKGIVDSFINDVCSAKLDVSVPFKPLTDKEKKKEGELPPHPQNVSNEAKMVELEANYAAIATEQSLRDGVKPLYATFEQRRSEARASSSAIPSMVDPSTMAFDLTWDVPKSLVEALELGRRVLESEPKKEKEKEKGKGKGKAKEEGTVDLLGKELAEVRLESANLSRLTHRLSQFSLVASSYITSRTSQTHHALSVQASTHGRRGEAEGSNEGGIASVVLPAGGGGGGGKAMGVVDPRDLLRAISAADWRSSKGGQ